MPPDVRDLRLKCTKFDFGWGSTRDPVGGAHSAPPDHLAGFKGAYTSKWRGREGRGGEVSGREGKEGSRGEGREGIEEGRGGEKGFAPSLNLHDGLTPLKSSCNLVVFSDY